MTDEQPGLFDEPTRVEIERATPGERLRRRQAEAISLGFHPLCAVDSALRLLDIEHRSIVTRVHATDAGDYPRCGTCAFRVQVNGGARDWPKCGHGAPTYPDGAPAYTKAHRYTAGPVTDVRSWWPGCTDYQPTNPTDTTGEANPDGH